MCHYIRHKDSLLYRIKTSGVPGSCRRYGRRPIPCRSVARRHRRLGSSSSSVGYVWLSEATLDIDRLSHLQYHLRQPTKIPSNINWEIEREQALQDDMKMDGVSRQNEEEMKSSTRNPDEKSSTVNVAAAATAAGGTAASEEFSGNDKSVGDGLLVRLMSRLFN